MLTYFYSYIRGESFWDINKHSLDIPEFNELYTIDDSESKVKSSTIMWAIHLINDNASPYQQLDEVSRVKTVEKNILKKEGFFNSPAQLVIDVIAKYKEYDKGAPERGVIGYAKMLDKLTHFMMNTTPDAVTLPAITKLMVDFPKLQAGYEAMLDQAKKAKDRTIRGNQRLTMLYQQAYEKTIIDRDKIKSGMVNHGFIAKELEDAKN